MALNDEQRGRAERAFDNLLVEAQQASFTRRRYTLAELGGDAARFQQEERNYAQAYNQWNSNPLRAQVQAARRQADEQRAQGATQQQADNLYAASLNSIKQGMMDGLNNDLANQQARQQAQQELMQNVTSFNVMGIMTSLVKMMSGGNEILNMPGQLAGQLMQQRGVDPQSAMDNSFMTSAIASGLMGAGVDINNPAMQQYVGTTVASTVAPVTAGAPATTPAAALAAAGSAPQPSGPAPTFVATNGALPPAPGNTPATRPQGPAGGVVIS